MDTQNEFENSRKWNAKWIWTSGDPHQDNTYCLFRCNFDLDIVPESALAYIAADTRYRLYINGDCIGSGPPQSQPFFQYYDQRELVKYLVKGENCIAVVVNYLGTLANTRGGLLFELTDASGKTIAASNEDWLCKPSEAWTHKTHKTRSNQAYPFQEWFDYRKWPDGWTKPGFQIDSTWEQAVIVSGKISDRVPAAGVWSRLVPRDIPFMTEIPVKAQKIEKIEENIHLNNRTRSDDLSIGLSLPGKPLCHSTATDVKSLLGPGEGHAVFQCSNKHQDRLFDGIYDPTVVLDFGKVITARFFLDVEGRAGSTIEIGYAERLIDGHFVNSLEGTFADRLTMKDGHQCFETFMWKAFRYVKLRFRHCDQAVKVFAAQAHFSTYPFEEKGGFSSSDQKLNEVFEISRHTVRLCSNEFIMDTPWREAAQWLGDIALVSVPAIHACFGDTALTGKFFRQAAANQHQTGMISNVSNIVNLWWRGAIPDYTLHWIIGVWQQYLQTGQDKWIHSLWPQILRAIEAHMAYINARGLIEDMPYWVLIDWADTENRGESAAYNALFSGTLQTFIKMAKVRGDAYAEKRATDTLEKIHAVYQSVFFDSDRGLIADAVIDGQFSDRISEHANATPILFGLLDEETVNTIINRLWSDEARGKSGLCPEGITEAQPFYTHIVLNALDKAGRFDLALKIVRERWGERFVDRGLTSCLEEWYENGSWRNGWFDGFMRTHSHSWSASPADFLIRNLIGLQIIEPGCKKVQLNLREIDMNFDVQYPTPHGVINVKRKNGKTTIDAPGTICIVDAQVR